MQETFENISRININWPRNLDSASTQMLQAIFQRDPALRPTLNSIKRSSFFSGVNWNRLESTFEAARYETRTIVQSIYSGKKQSIRAHRNSLGENDQNWVHMHQFISDESANVANVSGNKSAATQHLKFSRRKLTDTQIKTIHEALVDF